MRLPMPARAFLDGFALGGIFPARRPSAPDTFFIEDEEDQEVETGVERCPRNGLPAVKEGT